MNGGPLDFEQYLAQTFQASQPGAAPQPVMLNASQIAPPMPAPAPVPPPEAMAPPPAPAPAPAPPPPPAPVAQELAAPPAPAPAPVPRYVQVGRGGVTPSREVSLLGPMQAAGVDRANDATEQAIQSVGRRNEQMALAEYALASEQVARAQGREAAMQTMAAKRDVEMQQRLADFDDSVKTLAAQRVDPDRFWASRGTDQKIGAMVAMALGGFLEGFSGGRIKNNGMEMINRAIDRDIAAQEFAYNAMRESVSGKKTAFAMAMEKYQNEDAARTAARAASLEAAQAQMAQLGALYKGTDAANRAEMAMADLEQRKADQRLKFSQFVQAQSYGPTYFDTRTGMPVTQGHIQARYEKGEDMGYETAQKIMTEQAKAQAEAAAKGAPDARKDQRDRESRWVPTSSTGKGYFAPTEKEAVDHREAQVATQEIIDLLDRIDKDSGSFMERVGRSASPVTTDTEKRIKTNSKALLGAINRAEKFGAMDKGTQEILQEMTGNPSSISGNKANIEALRNFALETRRRMERSATGSKPAIVPEGTVGAPTKPAW